MIDTLKLSLNETNIENSANLTVVPGSIEFNTGLIQESDLFVTKTGEIIRGKKAFLNTDLYNLTILPKYSAEQNEKLIQYEIKYKYGSGEYFADRIKKENFNSRIYLQTSLPKIQNYIDQKNDYNLTPVKPEQIPGIIKFYL